MPEQADWARIAVAVAATIVLAYVAAVVAGRITRSALSAMFHEIREGAASAIHQPTRIVRGAVFVVTLLALVLPALELAGVQTTIGLTSRALTAWLFGSGLRILVISVLSYALLRIIAATARRLEARLGEATSADMLERLKRARTVSSLVQHALTALVVGIAGLMVLHELQVDIMPILTGAGVVGLAIGFGAQTLVKDLIAGFFLTLENQVRIGDVVNINGTGGLVEEINLRTIVLRDGDGAVHVFPNGSIERLSNRTKDYAFAVVDVGVPYTENVDQVMALLREIGAALASDPKFGANVLEPVEVLGIDSFEDVRLVIRVRMKTVPLKQWDISREFRRRIAITFAERGIVLQARSPLPR